MNPFVRRLLRRTIMVALALAVIGYLFAETFLLLSRMNGGGSSGNEAVRWRAPLSMAGIGIVLQIMFESLAFALRRKKPASPTPLPSSESTSKQSGQSVV